MGYRCEGSLLLEHDPSSCVSPALSKCLSGNVSERKLAFSGCEQSLVPEGDLSRWRLRRLKNPMISRSGFRTDTEFQGDEIAMEPFTPFLTLLAEIEDPRRAEGKLYRLPHVMLFAIMAIVAGANSYRTIHTFIDVH